MLFIPGFLISWATFPGVIVHEHAHKMACQWRNIRIHEVNYFSADGSGYVRHETPRSFPDTLAISTAPFIVNTLLSVALYTVAVSLYVGATFLEGTVPPDYSQTVTIGIGWLGLSIGWHAIPSFGDTGNIWHGAKREWRSSTLALFALPLVAFLYLGNLLKFLWFDALYSLALGGVAATFVFQFA